MKDVDTSARRWVSTLCIVIACAGVVVDALLVAKGTITTEKGWLVLAAAGILLFASQVDRLTELSGLGVSAKLREKIAEADATIQDARELFAILSDAVLTDLIGGDFMDGMGTQRRLDLHDHLMRELKESKLTRSQLERAERGWRAGMEMLFNRLFRRLLDERLERSTISNEEKGRVKGDFRRLLDFDNWAGGSPDEYRRVFDGAGLLDAEVAGWISEFRAYRDTGNLSKKVEFLDVVYWRERRGRAG